ncbi:hypothetical protein [Curtobacterium sp. MCSS17_016]|uniref:hypothetical protein n=1 Tax=Curtobacterium sp. MCSS17_016 TaxID=2175644 RepID=UPI000DA90999|nr:hypothetical protein [Curtobacterium sp. MCSS17_016]WIE81378.1 hypothetical protein DEJ19_019275 [Curtobacterium sp. MCSS17_016]
MTANASTKSRPSKFAWLSAPAAVIGCCALVSAGVLVWQLLTGHDPVFGQVALLGTVLAFAATALTR